MKAPQCFACGTRAGDSHTYCFACDIRQRADLAEARRLLADYLDEAIGDEPDHARLEGMHAAARAFLARTGGEQ